MRVLKVIGVSLAVLLLILLVSATGLYACLRTDAGRTQLAERLNRLEGIKVGAITGDLFSDTRLASLELSDPQGVWLRAGNLHLQWHPARLLQGLANGTAGGIALVEIGTVELLRSPSYPPTANDAAGGMPSLRLIRAVLPQRLVVPQVSVDAAVAGTAQQLALQSGTTNADTTFDVMTSQGPETQLRLEWEDADTQVFLLHIHAAPGGVLGALLRLPAASGVDADATATLSRDLKQDEGQLTATAGRLHLDGSGSLAGDGVKAELALAVSDLNDISALAGTPLAGAVDVKISLAGPLTAVTTQLDLTGKAITVGDAPYGDPSLVLMAQLDLRDWQDGKLTGPGQFTAVANSAGRPVQLAGKFALAGTRLELQDLTGNYAPYTLHGTGSLDWQAQQFTADITSEPMPLQALMPQAARPLTVAAHAQADGAYNKFTFGADATLADPADTSTLKLDGTYDAGLVGAKLVGALRQGKATFDLAAAMQKTASSIDLSDASLTGPGLALNASDTWQQDARLPAGKLTLKADDLRPFAQLLGLPLSGSVTADAALSGSQAASLKLSARDLDYGQLRVGKLDVLSNADDLQTQAGIELVLVGNAIDTGSAQLQTLNAHVKGSLAQQLSIDVTAAGSAKGQPFTLTTRGYGSYKAEPIRQAQLTLQQFDGRYAGKPITLVSKPVFALHGDDAQLSPPLRLQLAGGTVTAVGAMTPVHVDGTLTLTQIAPEALPLSPLPPGVVNATLHLTGTPAQPRAQLQSHASLRLDPYTIALDANADWQGGLKGGQLITKATAQVDKARAIADARIAAPFSIEPLTLGIDGSNRVNGAVDLDVPLETFNATLRASEQRVAGKIDGRVTLAGTLDRPQLSGNYRLRGGSYDSLSTGICLRNLEADLAGAPHGFALRNLSARDPAGVSGGGALSGQADFALSDPKRIAGRIAFNHLRLFCGGPAVGTVDGQLTVAGVLTDATIAGRLKLNDLNVQLPGNRQQATIPEVTTERLKPRADQSAAPIAAVATGDNKLALDIKLDAPERLFVRGRGLDAEFGGGLQIGGVATAPQLAGKFTSRRGRFTLLDRQLKLDTAELLFEGPMPPAPFLTVVATTTVNGTALTASLTGTAQSPKLELTSTPALPQDEQLALLLFGRQLSSISPFQAYQLAQAARELAGDSSGPGILDKLRTGLGLDTLDVGTDSSNNVTVTTGKYVTDRVFVGVEQGSGTDPQSKAVTTEIELTPSISANTALDGAGNQTLGVQWKKDY